MDLHSPHLVNQNIERIAQLFPNCVTESAEGLKIDFDQLRQELSGDIIEGGKERYRLDWPGKREAIVTGNLPTTSTLRPARDESVDFDNTENIYIEGDNLEVLKVLQESYLNKVKMIYIDPPYNTGKDFVYRDNFATDVKEWREREYCDEAGRRMEVNPNGAGRYHSDWLSMMYPRLKLARNLLTEDGVIFISIDDNEVHNLRKVCDEIFGEGNFVAQICHKARASVSNDKIISPNHNHILFYAKDERVLFSKRKDIGLAPILSGFDRKDEKGEYKLVPVDGPGGAKKGNPYYEFEGILGYWRFSKERMQTMFEQGLIVKTSNNLQQKYYLETAKQSRRTATTWWDEKLYTSTATSRLKELLGSSAFDTPKPVELIRKMIEMFDLNNSIVLDFFSGSATTAHATMQLNAEDGGNRKFIMVQLPEETDEKSEAYKAGYKTIAEIGKERIRRAAAQIKAEQEKKQKTESDSLFDQHDNDEAQKNLDLGFRVYKLDSSNMKDVYYSPASFNQEQLDMFADNIKDDRTDEDLVAQVMLDWGLPLSLKIEQKMIAGKKVYAVADDYLYCCFDDNLDEQFAREVATHKPLRIVFRDKGFVSDTAKENVRQLLKQLTPDTLTRVL